ncbi:MAG: hypothetical protein PSV18_12270 [Methylobacter sp.]|uniref:Uncharacterized protein n=1 Tax=Candidatus Methylobacter titanis TaxID=3053457 RepID=A0AA43Q9J7_9GAMM|nr:hypothetical protein [Candidatus Methylobacter titanis]MDI1293506.1 hypothetical protein [Candidatus Methylobacter titanis]
MWKILDAVLQAWGFMRDEDIRPNSILHVFKFVAPDRSVKMQGDFCHAVWLVF